MKTQEVENRIMEIYKERNLTFPMLQDRPYIIRISAVLPVDNEYYIYKVGSGAVSNPIDWFVLNLLRARTDAKLVGANTLRNEHTTWTVFDPSLAFLLDYHKSLGKKTDINIILTERGDLGDKGFTEEVFNVPNRIRPVILTTSQGHQRILGYDRKNIRLYELDDLEHYNFMYVQEFLHEKEPSVLVLYSGDTVNYQSAFRFFKEALEIKEISIEAGPSIANHLQNLDFIDELFLTVIPVDSEVELVKDGRLATESELNDEFIELSRVYGDSKGNIYPGIPENRKESELFIFRRLRRK